MRIGVLANTVDAQYGLQTGGHLHFFEIAKRLSGADVRAFVPGFVREEVAGRLPNAEVVSMPTIRRYTGSKLLMFAATLVSWAARWRQLRECDVLYASSHFLGDTIPAIVARGSKTVVVVFHLVEVPWLRPGNWLINCIAYATERLSLALVRARGGAIVVVNPGVRDLLAGMGFRNVIVTSTCGVDAPRLAPQARVRRSGEAVYLGRLSPTKGLLDVIEAWKILTASSPNARLRIVGDGAPAFVARLHELVRRYGLDENVAFDGRVDDAEKWTILQTSALFVFPSKEEGWGIALAEAMACGLGCVAYDLEPFRHIFPAGLVTVAPGDVRALASTVGALLSDDERRHELARNASELARRFDWDSAAKMELSAIHLAVCGRGRR